MGRPGRTRLDELVVARGLAPTRSAARGLIMAGLVLVGGAVSDKAGTAVSDDAQITLKDRPRYVSRAGDKLAHALTSLGVSAEGVSALDVGASTGGFVDCLLQAGAHRVIAVDVGRGQLDSRLANDPRVYVLDRVNARHLTRAQLAYEADFLTMDVSFISITKVLPAVVECLSPEFEGLVLVKPQFEAGRAAVGKGGIVRNSEVHREVLIDRGRFVVEGLRLALLGVGTSGMRGADGNKEFFLHVGRGREKGLGLDRLEAVVAEVVCEGEMTAPRVDT
ncbi:MAG: TlyA family RNA methyltransferase [Thermoleophilia bacterium]|nr:TlyA family RNA methyltransferase [Thermoleophilia bacterium]